MIPKRCKSCKYKGTLDGITCKTAKLREEAMAKYEKLPSFPH